MVSLLLKSLPPEWSQGETVFWFHGSGSYNHPGLEWLELVWNYLRMNFATNDGLCRFSGLPLIPHDMSQVPISLVRLQQPSKIVVKSLHDEFLDETLIQSLKDLGLVIIQQCPFYLTLHPALFNAFIYPPSPHGVLKALSACSSVVGSNKHSLTDEGKRSLRKFFSKESSLEPQAKQLLRSLPLFETLNKSFVSGEQDLCAAPPEGSYPVPPRRDLIDVAHDDSKNLAHLLDIRCLSPTEFFLDVVFPDIRGGSYSNGEIDRIMGFVMERFQVYASEDARFEEALANLPFVPSESRRERAMDLFDPGIELLKRMLVEEDVFPVGEQYTNPTALVVLKKLGMKSEKQICAEDLYRSAKKISQMSNLEKAKQKSETIFSYLDSYSTKLQQTVSGVTLAQLLKDVPWVSEVKERPFGVPASLYSADKTSKAPFYKPTEVTCEDKVNLIGTVKPIVRVDSSRQLAKCFGWDKMPDSLDVVQHLKTVVTHYTPDEKQYYISIVKDIYAYLNQVADPEVIKEALHGIENLSWIWNGDGFCSPDVVLAKRPPIDLTPYICSLPSEVMQFSNFFSKFGMREHCDALFFVRVLHLMKQKYESGHDYPNTEVKRDLQLSADILNEIKPKDGEQLPTEIQEKVLIPTHVEGDSYLRLAPVNDCMYSDHEWLEDGTPAEEERDCFFVHPNIPHSTAELLQVRTRRNQLLEADEIGDEFGQEEKLTRRLNRLLEEYTDGFSVPKELIQNADDAGATEVRFLYDERTNEDAMTCLIDEGMKECQGPALWVYNDAEFRNEDFENIVKLNGGTKEEENEKIGKFGLGFNTVYNLTDVPMFLSRNYFVIFDPNTFYLGKAVRKKSKPGIKIDVNKNPEKKRKFRNQFKPFNGIFGCDLHLNKPDNSFPGTLFRFPLRTKEQAIRSEIKAVHYDNDQMRELLDIFVRGAKHLLLFTQNVCQLSIFHLPRESTEETQPKLMFQVTKSLSKIGIIRELTVPLVLSRHLRNVSTDVLHLIKQCSVLRASSEVAKHAGGVKEINGSLLKSAYTVDITSNVAECGRSFFEDKSEIKSVSEVWFVASSMGRGQAFKFSVNDKSLLPAAAVAVQLIPQERETFLPESVGGIAAGGKSHHNGTVFCYLPLPIHSGLPVHINGAFAVDSSRRHLKEKTEDDKTCVGVEWNNVLLKDCVCAAYLDLLEDMKAAATMYSFHSLWPRERDVALCCEPLARSFYEKVASGGFCLFSDGKRWVEINQVVFLEPNFRHHQRVGDISFAVLQMLVNENKVVIDLPVDVFKSFVQYGLEEKIQAKTFDKSRFFTELFFPNIHSVPTEMRDELILFALDDSQGEFDESIKAYACIPVSPTGTNLKRPSELVNPKKAAASLFLDGDERFPSGTTKTFLDSVRLAKLEQLGMVGDDPPWNLLEERAASVSILNEESSKAALERAKALKNLLERKLYLGTKDKVPEEVHKNLLQIKFLPAATKPEGFPLFWKGVNLRPEKGAQLVSAKEGYLQSMKYLVCCSEPIIDLYVPSNVEKFLQLDKNVTLQHIVTQLDFASRTELSLNSVQFETVKLVCLEAYKNLQAALNEEQIDDNQVKSIFQDKKFILVGREFVDTKHVAFELPVDCCPYLYKLRDDLAKPFGSLMKSAGVKEFYEASDFVTSLEEMKRKFEDTALKGKNLQVAVHLACQLGECLTDCDAADGKQQTIYIPDSQGIMQPASKLCIQDCLWISDENDVYYANNMIPHPICLTLGVKTRRAEALSRFAFGIPFGQKEKLTNRLQRLLQAYPCEKEILKELLQNADDAEATEICFIKDPRQHPDERIFEESWKPLQGPALCVYNNKPFTEADIKGIQNLGEGSKGDDPNKTGQYGVGFNAVYHLTDVPTFASSGDEIGDVLCAFDPNCTYVPGANPWEPGRMFKETTKLRGNFPDVFSCYNDDHFPLRDSTMFRFPLRTEEMASRSKISDRPVTLEKLTEMMESLKGELFEVLLFVNNVRKITLCDIDQSGQVVNSYFVKAEISEEDSLVRQSFSTYVKDIGRSMKQSGNESPIEAAVKTCSYVLNLEDSSGNKERWLIVQQIGFESEVNESIIDAYQKHDLGMLPRGGVACLLQRISVENELVERRKKVYCFLPLPIETDLPVHINGHFALDHEARTNFWRNESGGYKRDWNNVLMSDVIASCYLTLLDKVRSFYHLPVAHTSEEVTLSCSKDWLAANVDIFERLFPSMAQGNPYLTTLVKSVYQEMDRKCLRFLPVLRDNTSEDSTPTCQLAWLPLTGNGKDKAFFNCLGENDCFSAFQTRRFSESENEIERLNAKRALFEEILLQTGFNLVAFSLSVFKEAQESGVHPHFVSPSAVMEFYKSYSGEIPPCKVGSLHVDVRDTPFKNVETVATILTYCKDSENFLEQLPGLPLLVTQDNHLHTFSTIDPKFLSRHHEILPQCKEIFVHDHVRANIFWKAESLKASVFKRFDVNSFAANLHRTLPQEYINSGKYVEWNPKQTIEPNVDWLYRVWKFLAEEIDDALSEWKRKQIEMSENNQAVNKSVGLQPLSKEKETHMIRTVLKPLAEWCILPCTETVSRPREISPSGVQVKQYLLPLSLSESVLHLPSLDTTNREIVEILRLLSLPELNGPVLLSTTASYTLTNSYRYACRLVASINSPKLILKALNAKMTRNPYSLRGKLKASECRTILQYFSKNVKDLSEDDKRPLRRLPFYQAIHGGFLSIDGHSVCVVPVDIPGKGMEVLESMSDVVFLTCWSGLSELQTFLEFESASSVDMYCKFILKFFHFFCSEARLVHLKHIRDSILTQIFAKEGDQQRLLSCLETTNIIPCSDGTLVRASSYYDPMHRVFKALLSDDMFPPEPFNSTEWLPFLRSIGLIHEISQDIFKMFALKIANEAVTQPAETTENKSKVLVAHLFGRNNVVEEGLLQAISDIKFVPSDPVKPNLRAIHRPYGERNDGKATYISFRGSVLAKHAKIAWTTAALLPQWANPKEYQYLMHAPDWKNTNHYCNAAMAKLGILPEPTVELVTSHCKIVSIRLEKERDRDLPADQMTTRMSVMTNIYRFLEAKATSGPFAKNQLRHIPCILVEEGRRLVRVDQIVIELNKEYEIQPYLYRVPAELFQFKDLFQYLGCASVANVSHFAMVLDKLKQKCKEKQLDPNEKICALTAERGIFEVLQDHSEEGQKLSSLYLPATRPFIDKDDGPSPPVVLQESAELLFDDAPFYRERIKGFDQLFLVDLSKAKVRCKQGSNYEDLVMLLPQALRPQMLSTVVIEKFTDSSENGDRFDLGAAVLLKRSLHSPQFCRGIIRLIRHASREYEEKIDESVVATIKNRLQSIEVHGMSKIVTQLLYKGITIPGSEFEKPYFLEKVSMSSEEIWNVYVNAVDDAQKTSSAIALNLANVISKACKRLLRDAAMFIPLMLQSQPEEISSFLDMMKIHQDDSYDGEEGQILPPPGSFIPIAEQHLLNAAFSYFKPGEYVGYEVDDPSLKLEDGDATYIYAVIIEEVSNPDTSLITKSYKINIGNEKSPKIVLATELYKFYRFQEIVSAALISSGHQGTNTDSKHEIFQEITKTLEEAWGLSEDRRRQVVKRLFLLWHPDKNPGNEEFCTEVFQHIKNEIERLEREGWGRSERERSESYHHGGSYGAFFGFWGTRAREYSSRRREYQETYHRHYGTWGHGTRTWEVPPSFSETNPQPGQARRWFRQAEADLNAVVNDVHTGNASYEWACFKCHQV